MLLIEKNRNLSSLSETYLFKRTGELTREYERTHPGKNLLRLGIGDTSLPILGEICDAMTAAIEEISQKNCGYQPEVGQDFLRRSIRDYYGRHGVLLSDEEIFVSDGAKSDIGNIFDIFGSVRVAIQTPYYPAYLDDILMRGLDCIFMQAGEYNEYVPSPSQAEKYAPCVVILCSPNNPTGVAYSREVLEAWVDFALSSGSLIIFDSAYSCFITSGSPRSIFEIEGARKCAIEIGTLSKYAGFTGLRCGWCVIPCELDGGEISRMWSRRQSTRFNGLSYVTARGSEAALSEKCENKLHERTFLYISAAKKIRENLTSLGREYVGGTDSPYIWMKVPTGEDSWEYFRYLLEEKQVALTPGAGFGGEGYMRISAFGAFK